jgi:hypothetical protein
MTKVSMPVHQSQSQSQHDKGNIMASEYSTYLQNAIINATLRNTAYTSPAVVYVALSTTTITAGGSITEISGGSYARQAVTLAAPSSGAAASNANVTFPTATTTWGTITDIGIYDASTGGNLLYFTPLTVSKTITSGDIFQISTGNLTVSLA